MSKIFVIRSVGVNDKVASKFNMHNFSSSGEYA